MNMQSRWFFVALIVVFTASGVPAWAQGDTAQETVDETAQKLLSTQQAIKEKQQEILELDSQIKTLQDKQSSAQNQEMIISNKLRAINERLAKARLELQQTQLSIAQVRTNKVKTEQDITKLQKEIELRHEELGHVLRTLYTREQLSFFDVLLRTGSLSDVLAERAVLQLLQDQSVEAIQKLRVVQADLAARRSALEVQETDLGQLLDVFAAQQVELADQEGEQQDFLAANKERQVQYERKLADAAAARREIEQGLFALKGAGVKLSLNKATDMASLAGKFTGVRPALLLGVLKVESNIGGNIGNGLFPDDMQPASREPFLRIMKELGRDPHEAPISAAPSYGWGGAMGPAQIMPQTWEGIATRIAGYLNKPTADPYELLDAFVGTSIILGDYGAFDPAREREAAGRYLAGPNWQKYSWYIDRVMAVALEYEQEL